LRKIHRWVGLFCFGLVVFYCVTGIALNHRRDFDYFLDRFRTTQPLAAPMDTTALTNLLDRLAALTGEDRPPTVVKITPDGTVALLYGSHGVVTYRFAAGSSVMERIEKRPWQPWTLLNRFHKVAGTRTLWLMVADVAAAGLILVSITGLFVLRYRRLDWLLLAGGLVLVLGCVVGL